MINVTEEAVDLVEYGAEMLEMELTKRTIIGSFNSFFHFTEPADPYYYGVHTKTLIRKLQWVMDELEAGRSVFVIFNMPPRHGKSDTVSRRFPAWTLLKHPGWEFILTSFNYDLATDMSVDSRKCFRELAPMYDLGISRERDQVACWKTTEGGAMYSTGLGGTINGRGAHVLVIDDYLKNREDAESMPMRNKVWDSFRNDLMTRRAPVSAVVIVATRWHEDDLVGRIENITNPQHDNYDEDFPKFDVISFSAENDNRESKWLFPERFGEDGKWYKAARALVGSYGWQSQFQQDPKPRRGNMLRADLVKWVDDIDKEAGPNAPWEWGVDLAHSEKELNKDDPDYTHLTHGAVVGRNIYIKNVLEMRKTALKRDKVIQEAVEASGATRTIIEVVGAALDAYVTLKAMLAGISTVHKYTVQRDLVSRAQFLDPIFEAGNVYVQRAPWNRRWEEWMKAFPNGGHDDAVASLVALTYKKLARKGIMGLSR